MKISESELKEFKHKLEECIGMPEMGWGFNRVEREWAISWLATRPFLLFPSGFNEARSFSKKNLDAVAEVKNLLMKAGADPSSSFYGAIENEVILRNSLDDEWYLLSDISGRDPEDKSPLKFHFLGLNGARKNIQIADAIECLENSKEEVSSHVSYLSSNIWIPPHIRRGDILADQVSIDLINDIKNQRCSLKEIKPRDLEEIIAELLKSKGLSVSVTKATRDGGRDIIAKGEFFPGLESTMAVEVTSTETVGIQKVAQALYRNRHYPLLMVATSGRFSSGVVKEKNLQENQMRLILSDSLTIGEWINNY